MVVRHIQLSAKGSQTIRHCPRNERIRQDAELVKAVLIAEKISQAVRRIGINPRHRVVDAQPRVEEGVVKQSVTNIAVHVGAFAQIHGLGWER